MRGIKGAMTQRLVGSEWAIGDAVWVEADGVDLVINSIRTRCFNPTLFTDLGIDITAMRALIIKSMNHFYAAFEPVAAKVIHVANPGAANMDLTNLPLTKRDGTYFLRVEDPFSVHGISGDHSSRPNPDLIARAEAILARTPVLIYRTCILCGGIGSEPPATWSYEFPGSQRLAPTAGFFAAWRHSNLRVGSIFLPRARAAKI
ncbi:MlrC C-terminal domain-containing protein [Marimonas arenosa]|uniref:MlrC C-terminal domain-containing protein n=1 Tax=Marimonas arenosa TaxID=1795305 RepID=A0AAE4B3A9_9RHOB|nr:MlrC C-terminal domain-containing protein [Marimonas arenosa]MDQ2089092.1 MlrC C-terminal domain-containing protein [Marimonas arenosa]